MQKMTPLSYHTHLEQLDFPKGWCWPTIAFLPMAISHSKNNLGELKKNVYLCSWPIYFSIITNIQQLVCTFKKMYLLYICSQPSGIFQIYKCNGIILNVISFFQWWVCNNWHFGFPAGNLLMRCSNVPYVWNCNPFNIWLPQGE